MMTNTSSARPTSQNSAIAALDTIALRLYSNLYLKLDLFYKWLDLIWFYSLLAVHKTVICLAVSINDSTHYPRIRIPLELLRCLDSFYDTSTYYIQLYCPPSLTLHSLYRLRYAHTHSSLVPATLTFRSRRAYATLPLRSRCALLHLRCARATLILRIRLRLHYASSQLILHLASAALSYRLRLRFVPLRAPCA